MSNNQLQRLKQLAKQGDLEAIATLIQHSFKRDQIEASVQTHGDTLEVSLYSATVPDQALTRRLERGLKQLEVESFSQVTVAGYQQGQLVPAWVETVPLSRQALEQNIPTPPTRDPIHLQWQRLQPHLPLFLRNPTIFSCVVAAVALLWLVLSPISFILSTIAGALVWAIRQPDAGTAWSKLTEQLPPFVKVAQLEIGLAIVSLYCLLIYTIYRIPFLPYLALAGSIFALSKAIYIGVSQRWRSLNWTLNGILIVSSTHLVLASYLVTLIVPNQTSMQLSLIPILLGSLLSMLGIGYYYKETAILGISPMIASGMLCVFLFWANKSIDTLIPSYGVESEWRAIFFVVYVVIGLLIYGFLGGLPALISLMFMGDSKSSGMAGSIAMLGPYICVFATLPFLTFNQFPAYLLIR
ncbi:MAG: hypothetical protein AAGF24_04640 [Cyanobacteria bacterium P01_H01_bin.121]